jgi:adenylate cyclase
VQQRRLAAILAADVVGYSRLMGLDEAGTLAALKSVRRQLVDPKIAEHQGRIVKVTGDGMLTEFPSVVNAVACAAEIQQAMLGRNETVPLDRRIEFRMGINVGDVIVEGDDLFGDGVNVAARLEAFAKPGGIAISSTVRDHVGDRLNLLFEDAGDQAFKNIARPVRVFQVGWNTELVGPLGVPAEVPTASPKPLALPTKPSIAVLPFTNLSGDPEQEYFADGLVEDVITNLSQNPGLLVIARNSTFVYKGKATDIRKVAEELGVGYVLEGSVRRAANRLRITGQLVEGSGATHVWADKFEGSVEDIFDLQDRMTESIVGAIEPSLRQAEIERSRRKRPENLDAYDLFLQALPHAYANTPEGREAALRLLGESLRLDPDYAAGHAFAAWSREQRFLRGGLRPEDKEAALEHARLALLHGTHDPQALSIAAFVRANLTHDYEAGLAILDRALEMNRNSALAYGFSALVCCFSERYERGSEHAHKALRLSPFDPLNYHPYLALGEAELFTGNPAQAIRYLNLAIQSNPGFSILHALLVASHTEIDNFEAAHAAVGRLLEAAPDFTVSGFVRMDVWRPHVMDGVAASLRKAGVPE